jgi:4-amino-4-deoxy-L-arabinose transferase-like glycosyltransferase
MAAGGAFVLAYLFVALTRLGYPYELEWMEGGMVDHVRRVLAGSTIYPKPSLEFVSFLYPPLYYWTAAGLAQILGIGFLPLRLLSFVSSLGVFALLFAFVRRETTSALSGALAVALFAATYDRVGGWFDIARLDSFYLLLLLAAAYALRFAASARGAVLAGALLGAAFLTKQSALVVAVPLVAYAAWADRRQAPWFAGTATLVMAGGYIVLNRMTEGWFHYYCFYLPAHHPRLDDGLTAFWTSDLLPALPLATLLGAGFAFSRIRAGTGPARVFYPALAVGMVGSSWSVRNMVGAEVNNLLPAFAAVALLAALGWDALRRRAERDETFLRSAPALAASVLLLAQLAWLSYDPRSHLPTAADRAAGDRLVARLAAIDGDIFVPHHGYLARLAGKRDFAHTLAMDNVYLDDRGPARQALEAEMRAALAERRFAAVLLESDGRYGVAILNSYEAREPLFESADVFWPVTGGRLRPEALCLPK